MPNIIEITDFSAPGLDVFVRLTEAQPVSYTHLDVYKRQDQRRAGRVPGEQGRKIHRGLAEDDRRHLQGAAGQPPAGRCV